MKNYDTKEIPGNAVFAASTPVLTEKSIPAPILHRHMAPKGKAGKLIVLKGSLQLVWEDTGETFDADPEHSVLIEPERFHHVKITGPVRFRIDFFKIQVQNPPDEKAVRPGEKFL